MAIDPKKTHTIDDLKKEFQRLDKEKTTAEADLRNATKAMEDLKKEARDNWETDDLPTLRKKLEDLKAENEKKRADYQRHLEKVNADLIAVEEQFKETH